MMKSQLKLEAKAYSNCINNICYILSGSEALDKEMLVNRIVDELNAVRKYICDLKSLYSYYDRQSHK